MPSLGDKRAIFLRVLKAYAEAKGARAAKALLSPQSLRDSIAGFLRFAVESATEKGSARGCLLICVAPVVDDAEVGSSCKAPPQAAQRWWKVASGTGSPPGQKSHPTFR